MERSSPYVRAAEDGVAPAPDPMVGRVLAGRFTILGRLGAGSMGTVYRAVQAPIGRPVAIKILRSDRAVDEASRARFLREARANSALTSPHTVTVFDFGQSETGDFYLAMELLEGESLGDRLRRIGRLHPAAALDTARQALVSLSEAHAKGIVHRDLKPDNLFFARAPAGGPCAEIVKVLDFGIAKMMNADFDHSMSAVETQAGIVFGTPRYMSPEQAQGKPLDCRSDLYSLGVILYHMMTGCPPYTDDDAIVVMARHIKAPPPPMRQVAPDASISEEVEGEVMRVLEKEPSRRPQSADEMLAELTRILESDSAWRSGVRLASAPPSVVGLDAPEGTPASVVAGASSPHGRPWTLVGGLAGLACAVVAFALAWLHFVGTSAVTPVAQPSSPPPPPAVAASPARAPTLIATSPPVAPIATVAPVAAVPPTSRPEPRFAPAPRRGAVGPSSSPTPASAPKPAPKSAVGYGYLE